MEKAPETSLVAFGEVLLRLAAPKPSRLAQCDGLEMALAGAEANVAAGCAVFGHRSRLVSAVPQGALAEVVMRRLRSVNVTPILATIPHSRLGLYFLEHGTSQLPAEVLYDRQGSAFALAGPESYDWQTALESATWFHTTGINPALSEASSLATFHGMQQARGSGVKVSFDPNHRARLWPASEAGKHLQRFLPLVDLLISGTSQLEGLFDIIGKSTDFEAAASAAQKVHECFGIPQIAIPLRRGNGSRQARAALLFYRGEITTTRWMEFDMLDPLGGGDAFAAGLLSGLMEERPRQEVADLAVASACIKHAILGDLLACERHHIEAFAHGAVGVGMVR